MVHWEKNRGFTLIEIAIVLVVIGPLLGAIPRGQELISNAKVKSYASDFHNIPIMLYGYQDRFKELPGDDAQAVTHLPGATPAATAPGTVGNGVIDGAWNSDETCVFWQHVRLAGRAPGSPAVDCSLPSSGYWPKNANGGQIGIQSNTGFVTMTGGMHGSYIICSSNIPGQIVLQLDATIDDGNSAAGSMRAIQQSAVGGAPSTTATVQANRADSFIVRMSM